MKRPPTGVFQLNAVRRLHAPHEMPLDVSAPMAYNVDARTNICQHCSVLSGVPVVWPCETAALAGSEPVGDHEGEDEWTY